jgi:hypothetical protein
MVPGGRSKAILNVGVFSAVVLGRITCAPISAVAASVPVAHCQTGDLTETGLQGQVPIADRTDGRAAIGYNCNLKLLGSYADPIDVTHQQTAGWASLDMYKNCVYYGQASGTGVTNVVDISDPTHPMLTATLNTPAMVNPWESLRVNARRGLLVADHSSSSSLDVYDVSQDCRHPKLLRSLGMPTAMGHEGWFQPDGMVYYMSCNCASGVWAIDLNDPSNPKEMASFSDAGIIHGGSISADGTRGFLCHDGNLNETQYLQMGFTDSLVIVDTSDIAMRRPNPKIRVISSLPWTDNLACQGTYPITYAGHPYVVQYGESSNPATRHCASTSTRNFSAPRIVDIADEKTPVEVSNLFLEVDDPANCAQVQADYPGRSVALLPLVGGGQALFIYDVHHCSPDRLENPTILACEQFLAGLRVYDIRDPQHPRELAYYNKGTVSLTDQTVDAAVSRPVVLSDRGLVVWTSEFSGVHVSSFEGGVFPLSGGGSCTDYFYSQYNPAICISAGAVAGPVVSAHSPLPNTASIPRLVITFGTSGALALLVAAASLWVQRRRREHV